MKLYDIITEAKSGPFKSKAIGNRVKIKGGDHKDKEGKIVGAEREHTFSAMVPFKIIYKIELDDGQKVYVRRELTGKSQALKEGGTGSGRPTEKVRPNKNLWFQQRELWLNDLRHTRGSSFDLLQTEDEEEGDIFATNKDRNVCYGAWRKGMDQGVTFAKPRPLQIVVNPKTTLKQMLTAPPFTRGP